MKRIFILFLLLALSVVVFLIGFNVMAAGAKGDRVADPTSTAQPSQTAMPETCKVYTGVDAGAVNLRSCAGTSCGVLDTLTEGESLTILTAGNWTQVTRADGVTGWLNSKYCKGK